MNTEGRVQTTVKAVPPLLQAREDWEILRALGEVIGVNMPYSDLASVRERLYELAPHFREMDTIVPPLNVEHPPRENYSLGEAAFEKSMANYYFTNAISRASPVLSKASATLPLSANSYFN